MAFDARVFRILIASPSDVSDERDVAVNVIQEWNDRYSSERNIVLLPLRWETHSAPEFGRRPQEVINRQVVDQADMLVGIFWTRIGTPTGVADSGTLEEIERIANKGNLIMLYFSTARQNPDEIDTKQLESLRDFRKKISPKALIESYSNIVDFRDKLVRHLEIQIKQLAAEVTSGEQAGSAPKANIEFEFADMRTIGRLGHEISATTSIIDVQGIEKIEDYNPEKENDNSLVFPSNKDYYRDSVKYYINQVAYIPIRFWFKNVASIGLRDIFVELKINSDGGDDVIVQPYSQISAPPRINNVWGFDQQSIPISKSGDVWLSEIEFNALQPQREYSPPFSLAIGPTKSGKIYISAKIYADIFSTPLEKMLTIHCEVRKQNVGAKEILNHAMKYIKNTRAS